MVAANTGSNIAKFNQIIDTAFPFDIEKRQLECGGRLTKHWGLFRSDTGECVGNAVKEGFTPHTKDDIRAMGESAIHALGDMPLVISAKWWNDTHHLTIGPTKDMEIEVAKNDAIFPRFHITAGNGTRAHMATGGLFRHLCTNLMELSKESGFGFHMRHTRQLRERMPEMIAQFANLSASWGAIAEKARILEAKVVDAREFIETVDPLKTDASDRTKAAWQRRMDAMIARLTNERSRRGLSRDAVLSDKATGWEAFNMVQGWAQHEQRRNGQPDRLSRALAAVDSPLVARALEVALAS